MKNIFKCIGISVILIFSFFYTEKINDILILNSELFNEIENNSDKYNAKYVNAQIEDDYIIPGLNGLEVDVFSSYYNMKDLEVFNASFLLYNEISPVISIDNNKDKIIIKGNELKNMVAIIVKDNKTIIDYSYSRGIKISRLVTLETFDEDYNYEQINNEVENFKKLERRLNKKNNSNICIINDLNIKLCQDNKKYLVKPSLTMNNYNLSDIKNEIKKGDIIYVGDNVSLTDYKLLIHQIIYQDLNIVYLSNLINEERDWIPFFFLV